MSDEDVVEINKAAPNKKEAEADEKPEAQKTAGTPARRHKRRRGDVSPPEENAQAWLVSFTDVMALMLTFFVLLFSMSHPRTNEWSEMTAALKGELYTVRGWINSGGPLDVINIGRIERNQALPINYVYSLLETVIRDNDALKNVTVEQYAGRVVLALPEAFLFEENGADILDEGAQALYALGGALSRLRNKIEVVGHVEPLSAAEKNSYDNDWELSMMRAARIAAILKNVGYEKDITIRGMGAGRYQELAGSTGNQADLAQLSKRVEVVIMEHDGHKTKVFGDREDE